MKRIIILLSVLLILADNCYSRQRIKDDKYKLSIGPYLALSGGSASYNNFEGLKSKFAINNFPDFGVTGFIPIDGGNYMYDGRPHFGIYGDFGFSMFSYENRSESDNSYRWTTRSSYLILNLAICTSGFICGFYTGLPIKGNVEYQDSIKTIKAGDLKFKFGMKAGFILPLYYDKNGRLNIFIHYVLSFTEQFAQDKLPVFNSESYNTRSAELTIGLSYLFNLTEK